LCVSAIVNQGHFGKCQFARSLVYSSYRLYRLVQLPFNSHSRPLCIHLLTSAAV